MIKDFNNLGISQEIVSKLNEYRINVPTPIQSEVIPYLMKGRDVIGQAQTGTGKTLAFVLPMLESIDPNNSSIQGLIVTPTRELAIQITEEVRKLAPVKGLNILAAYGGQDVDKQINRLKGAIHIVIATPGRLLDHLRRNTISFGQLKFLVLDEADQMLQMGFLGEVEEIIAKTPKRRQTMLFSATMPDAITKLATRYMQNPQKVKVESEKITLSEIKQLIIETTDRGKQDALYEFISMNNPFLAIIFCRTKRRASHLNELLLKEGYNSDELHGDLSQAKRERVMKSFRDAEIQYLVATDIAARGLDVEGVTHVINYDIPFDTESYIHRIGRTGRAGHTGVAVTFVTPKDKEDILSIEKGIKMTIKKQKTELEKEKAKGSQNDNRARTGRDESRSKDRDKNSKFNSNNKDKGRTGEGKKTIRSQKTKPKTENNKIDNRETGDFRSKGKSDNRETGGFRSKGKPDSRETGGFKSKGKPDNRETGGFKSKAKPGKSQKRNFK